MEDYYAVLEIERIATYEEIKLAYRKKIREYHPDINKDPRAEAIAKVINQAWEVLSDNDKRASYDMQLGIYMPRDLSTNRKGYTGPTEVWEDATEMAQRQTQQGWYTAGVHIRIWTQNGWVDIVYH